MNQLPEKSIKAIAEAYTPYIKDAVKCLDMVGISVLAHSASANLTADDKELLRKYGEGIGKSVSFLRDTDIHDWASKLHLAENATYPTRIDYIIQEGDMKVAKETAKFYGDLVSMNFDFWEQSMRKAYNVLSRELILNGYKAKSCKNYDEDELAIRLILDIQGIPQTEFGEYKRNYMASFKAM